MGNSAAKPEAAGAATPAAATREPTPSPPLSPSALPPPVYTPAEALALIDAGASVMEATLAAAGHPLPGAPPPGTAAGGAPPPVWPPALTAPPAASGNTRPLPVRGGWLPLPGSGSGDGGGATPQAPPTTRDVGKWARLMAERLVDALDVLAGLGDGDRAARRALLRRLDALHDASDAILAATAGGGGGGGAATPGVDAAVSAAPAAEPPQQQQEEGDSKRRRVGPG